MPDPLKAPKAELERALFDDPHWNAYAVVDGAQQDDLPQALLEMGTDHHCLFLGALEPEVRMVAPHLVSLNDDAGQDAFDWLVDRGWGLGWAIYLRSEFGTLDVRRHLRTLTLAEMPDGKVVFFRYYDPLSLRSVVPSMEPEQKFEFFGKGVVESFFCETEAPEQLLTFRAEAETA
jgi:hypothetical protein